MGGDYCAAYGCYQQSTNNTLEKKISFHRFPKNQDLCKVAISYLDRYYVLAYLYLYGENNLN